MKDASAPSKILDEARPWFEEWRSSEEFEQKRTEIRKSVDGNFQFNRTEAKWLLEAWLISKYARLVGAAKIRLNRSDPPDAFVLIDEKVVSVEMTEIIEPGRKRGLEYRPGSPTQKMDPVENWAKRAEEIPVALKSGIQRKLSKKYPADTRLVVYLNIQEWGIRQQKIEAEIRSLLATQTGVFSGMDILWKEKLFTSEGQVIIDPKAHVDEGFDDDEELFRSIVQEQPR